MPQSPFVRQLRQLNNDEAGRKWIYVPYDQVTDKIGPLARAAPEEIGIILVESPWKGSRRPYHKQKLALILANLRHFALEQAARGVAVRHVVTSGPYSSALAPLAQELGEITMMQAAERELRVDLQPLIDAGSIKVVPHEGWLTTVDQLKKIQAKDGTYRMDAFYRLVRQTTGILMEAGKPQGGKYSFDAENRLPWKGSPAVPELPAFAVDEITEEVAVLIEKHFAEHPGKLDLEHLPVRQSDADRLWQWAKDNCLSNFGPYEDAMSSQSTSLFHTRISSCLNIHRLIPREIVEDVLSADIPLASKEGFIRQVIGWREFVHKVHVVTDGFRTLADENDRSDMGANVSYLGSSNDLPKAYWDWGIKSGLNCLDTVVDSVWQEGYSHHITRLMVLSNIANLLDVSPRQLTDWFWVAYTDAFDWVVEPNVMAMGTFGTGDLMTTKPYISGAAYINKMSDYCRDCQFDPAKNCPITRMYWAFLERHRENLAGNQRLAMPLNSLKKRSSEDKSKDKKIYETVLQNLQDAQPLKLKDLEQI
ncbi:MAG: cryptochrome/photolyase family protein [Cyanobacteria bacterium SZAS LIN-2]|nr:cryptochrome/photolyase family protein [Cyanobacteria bacterium SZAS LIN-2]